MRRNRKGRTMYVSSTKSQSVVPLMFGMYNSEGKWIEPRFTYRYFRRKYKLKRFLDGNQNTNIIQDRSISEFPCTHRGGKVI